MRKKMNFQALNPWLVKKTKKLMEKAELIYAEPNTGEQKKEWVTDCLNQALDKVDVAKIPNWIEDPLNDFLIEIVWHLLYSKDDDQDGE